MIIYGSRMYFRKKRIRSHAECEFCGKYAKMTSYQARKFGHIYFIPVIPLGSQTQVLRECSRCSTGTHFNLSELGAIVDRVTAQFKIWVEQIQLGHTEIELPDTESTANVGILMVSILDDLFCLGEIQSIDPIASMLDQQGMNFENEIVMAKWSEICGDLEQSRSRLLAASQLNPESPYPQFQLGLVERKKGNVAGAEQVFNQYLKRYPGDLDAYLELSDMYERKSDYPNIVKTYDAIYELIPHVQSHVGMQKMYKKACKKSGIQGKFLDKMVASTATL